MKVRIKKIYCTNCRKFKEFKTPKIAFIFDKALVLSITWDKRGSVDKRTFKEEKSIAILNY